MRQLNIQQTVKIDIILEWRWIDPDPSYGLQHATDNINAYASSQVSEIYYGIGNDFEEDVFHWLCKLENGNIAHIWGSCGAYTGWEICGELRVDEYANFSDAFHDLGMAKRDVNGVEFKEIFYDEVVDELLNEAIEKEVLDADKS